ncbi:asparagine synthase (glutamine-hydrolyzing) [Alkaliphilus serpentinus]|uniref:asparagine synthase (glutamine-hydrolyzing) n=2 Tax=Alkaliphilus serpentinus TaxID=1482731 RepID=A0A833HMR7_9FIRM|nr:asparagine synthase (glutamine-hydrolyzing) [Alkaliphilus serpentinus]KAB3528825.1 asparagine synthase (glutamine-hydrolyzing) [Alkaliphilus serpentinus]
MCGFVGWVDYEKNLLDRGVVMDKMITTLSKRGPDAEGVYATTNALLGHRRLIVVDPEGGGQPMTRIVDGRRYTIIYNGELYNTEDVRKLLVNRGYGFQSYSDTEVLLTAYIEWGRDCLNKLNGIYAFGIWDEEKKELFLARDRLGVKPLFYSKVDTSFVFASEIKAILANPAVPSVIEEEGILELFALGPARTPGKAVFKHIKEVPPAHYLIYSREGLEIRQYWQLQSKAHTEDFNTTVEHVKFLLMDAIERQLISDVPVCTFLSGGLDSSCISAVTAKAFEREGKGKLKTFSIDYFDNETYFQPSVFQPNSDKEWIDKMQKAIDSNHYSVIVDTPQLAEALHKAVLASDLPGMADVDSSLYLFCKEVRQQATVALSGECADEIFGGYPWFTREELYNANTFPWSQAINERQGILSKEFAKLPIAEYVDLQYKNTLREVPTFEGDSPLEKRIREIFYLNLKWFMVTLLNRKDRMSMANGLEVRVPFADQWLVEYVWNIPWDMKFYQGREKGLLRKALEGILPQDVIERKKSPYPKTHNPSYLKEVQKILKKIIENKHSPILQLISREKAIQLIESGGETLKTPWFGQLMTGPQLIAYLIQMDIWMREYKVEIR